MSHADEFCKRLSENLADSFNSNGFVKVTTPPSYLGQLIDFNEEQNPGTIILIYKQDKNKYVIKQILEISGLEDSLNDLSITGTPLECPFDNNETSDDSVLEDPVYPDDYYHAPLSMNEARKILTWKLKPPLPMWILTDASDPKRMFLLGAEVNGKDEWHKRSWASVLSTKTEKKPVAELTDEFKKTFKVGPGSGYKISSSVKCLFNIKDQPGMAKNSSCFIEATWKAPSYEVPISDVWTKVNLLLSCNVGNAESQISRWWRQLCTLSDLMAIVERRAASQQAHDTIMLPAVKPNQNGECNSDRVQSETKTAVKVENLSVNIKEEPTDEGVTSKVKEESLLDRVLALARTSDSASVYRQLGKSTEMNTTSALDLTIKQLTQDQRKGQDFTDHLWSLLIEAETYQELNNCVVQLIREIRKTQVVPFTFTKNNTRLATLLRNLKKSASVSLGTIDPLQLLVEIGLDKLKRDYMFMFLSSQISTEESLQVPKLPSFSDIGEEDWTQVAHSWLGWLSRLHTVLELVSIIHTTFSPSIILQVVSQALSKFLGADSPIASLQHLIENRAYQLRVPINPKEVKNFIEGERSFYKWQLSMSAEADKSKIFSTFVLLEDSPLPRKVLTELIDEQNDTLNLSNDRTINAMLSKTITSSVNVTDNYTYIQLSSIHTKIPC